MEMVILLIIAAQKPINALCPIVTNPAAGVIATNPTIAPIHAPTADIFLFMNLSQNTQVIMLVAEAIFVFAKAITASIFAPKEDPALKPNHPTFLPQLGCTNLVRHISLNRYNKVLLIECL